MAKRVLTIRNAGHEGGDPLEITVQTEARDDGTVGVAVEFTDGDSGRLYEAHLRTADVSVFIAALQDVRLAAVEMVPEKVEIERKKPQKPVRMR